MSGDNLCSLCGQDLRLSPNALRLIRRYEGALRDIDNATMASAERLREIANNVLHGRRRNEKRKTLTVGAVPAGKVRAK